MSLELLLCGNFIITLCVCMCVRHVCWGRRITLAIAPYELSTLLILLWLLSHGLSLGPGLTSYVGQPASEAVSTSLELGLQAHVTTSSFLPCVLRTDSGSQIYKTKTWLTDRSSQPSRIVLLHWGCVWPMTSSVPPHKQLPFSMPCLALCQEKCRCLQKPLHDNYKCLDVSLTPASY